MVKKQRKAKRRAAPSAKIHLRMLDGRTRCGAIPSPTLQVADVAEDATCGLCLRSHGSPMRDVNDSLHYRRERAWR